MLFLSWLLCYVAAASRQIVGGTMCGCLYVWARSAGLALLFRQEHAHVGPISTLAFDKHEQMPLLLSGGADTLVKVRSWMRSRVCLVVGGVVNMDGWGWPLTRWLVDNNTEHTHTRTRRPHHNNQQRRPNR